MSGSVGAYLASYDDVLGEQDDDETFLHNPLNVYALIRHVAVGWGIVENALEQEKNKRKGEGFANSETINPWFLFKRAWRKTLQDRKGGH